MCLLVRPFVISRLDIRQVVLMCIHTTSHQTMDANVFVQTQMFPLATPLEKTRAVLFVKAREHKFQFNFWPVSYLIEQFLIQTNTLQSQFS